jgi:hypothetical protein
LTPPLRCAKFCIVTGKPQIPAGLIKEYNQVVREFRESWAVLRAISIIRPENTSSIQRAKQLIRELQKNVVDIEKSLRNPAIGGIEGTAERLNSIKVESRVFRELLASWSHP